MKTWVTANPKGVVGKTSTLVPLAFNFAGRGFGKPGPQSRHSSKGLSRLPR